MLVSQLASGFKCQAVMAGLENLGMFCYSNAVLHALGNSKEVHDNLVTHSDMHTIPGIYAMMF